MASNPQTTTGEAKNTDKEIYREISDDYYSPRVFVTKEGDIGMCAGGKCVVKSISIWVEENWI